MIDVNIMIRAAYRQNMDAAVEMLVKNGLTDFEKIDSIGLVFGLVEDLAFEKLSATECIEAIEHNYGAEA